MGQNVHPVSDPLEHDSSPITTRPGLPLYRCIAYLVFYWFGFNQA